MENNPVEKHYDNIYSENEHAFGGGEGKPESLVTELTKYLQSGYVLELGAGQGRNSLYLTRHGLKVEAKDISAMGLEKLEKIAKGDNLNIQTRKADAREDFQQIYDAIVSTYMLHHLSKSEALEIISKMKEHTRTGGYNAVTVFTKEGDFFNKNPATDKFYPGLGEMKDVYADWEILEYKESNTRAWAKKEDGSPMFNIAAKILARK